MVKSPKACPKFALWLLHNLAVSLSMTKEGVNHHSDHHCREYAEYQESHRVKVLDYIRTVVAHQREIAVYYDSFRVFRRKLKEFIDQPPSRQYVESGNLSTQPEHEKQNARVWEIEQCNQYE